MEAPRRTAWLWAIAVAATVVLVYHGVLRNGFLQWDDDINVVHNPHVHALTASNLRWMFTDAQYMRRYLPLGWLRWAADWAVSGGTPGVFHADNLAWHALDAVLLFLLIRSLLPRLAPAGPPAALDVAAAAGALAWAIHPLRTETVAWISTGQYCEAVAFVELSFWAYLVRAGRTGGTGAACLLVLSLGAYAASLLSYPAAIGYPLALLILDFGVLRRARTAAVWIEKIPYTVLAAASLAATVASRYEARGIWTPPPTLAQFGVAARVMQAFYVWAYFVWKPLLPLHPSPVYTALVDFRPLDLPFIASAAAVLAVTVYLLSARRRFPGTCALWLCHLVLLAPMLGLTEHPHYTSDRYVYFASLVWSFALGSLLVRLWPARGRRWAALAACALALAAAGAASAAQIAVWRDSESLFRYVLDRLGPDPYRYDILLRLGRAESDGGHPALAESAYREAAALRPAEPEPRIRLGLLLFGEDRPAEAAAYLGTAARLDRSGAPSRAALVETLLQRGQAGDALAFCRAAVRLAPHLPDVHADLGALLVLTGDPSAAIGPLADAVRLDPSDPATRVNLALALRKAGREGEAQDQLSEALRLEPNYAPALQSR